jgi:hypothetical protein
VGRCDDLRFVGLKLIFLIVSVSCRCSRCSRREAWWKDGTGPPNKGYYAEDLTDAWERYSRYIATDEDSSQVSHVADDVADAYDASATWPDQAELPDVAAVAAVAAERPAAAVCDVCDGPMAVTEPGQRIRPACDPSGACPRHSGTGHGPRRDCRACEAVGGAA